MDASPALHRVLRESSDPANPDPEEILRVLERARSVAVVGMSRDPAKVARRIPAYLISRGLHVIPVNPHAERILGRPSLPTLTAVEPEVDMVLVFRPSGQAGPVVEAAAARPERPVIWLQEGIRADPETAEARAKGLIVVQDLCIYKVYRLLEPGA